MKAQFYVGLIIIALALGCSETEPQPDCLKFRTSPPMCNKSQPQKQIHDGIPTNNSETDKRPDPVEQLTSDGPQQFCGAETEALCEQVETPVLHVMDEAEVRERLIGRWFLCSSVSVFGTTDEIGLDILADGTWARLELNKKGQVVRRSGFDNVGTWELLDTSLMNGPGWFQLNLTSSGSGTVMTNPAFSENPQKMLLNNHGVFEGIYLAAEQIPATDCRQR